MLLHRIVAHRSGGHRHACTSIITMVEFDIDLCQVSPYTEHSFSNVTMLVVCRPLAATYCLQRH
jgi:hypothetical protein